jgi:hypothetical protein
MGHCGQGGCVGRVPQLGLHEGRVADVAMHEQ